MSTLERAIAIAAEAHAGQVDKGGAPYILHPLRVMMATTDPEQRIVGVLHDVLEDCPEWTPSRLRVAGFSEEIVAALVALTKQAGEVYPDFIERVKLNPLARRVKLADLDDNSDLRRIGKPGPEDFKRLRKYAAAITTLIGD